MHRGVRGIRNPWLLIDHRNAPAGMAVAREMIEPRYRTIVDVEGKSLVGQAPEREPNRGLDGAAMTDGDDVVAALRDLEGFKSVSYDAPDDRAHRS